MTDLNNAEENKETLKSDEQGQNQKPLDNSDVVNDSVEYVSNTETVDNNMANILELPEEPLQEKIVSTENVDAEGKNENIPASSLPESQEAINNDDIINAINLSEITKEVDKNVQDINISTIEDILKLLLINKYDFVTFEPNDNEVILNFRKDKVIVNTKYIKYPIYSNILLKVKQITKLQLESANEEQEGNGETLLEDKHINLVSKVVPSNFGEKLFLKATEIPKKMEKKQVKKMSFGKIMTFLGFTAIIALIIGGSFLAYVVFKAKTPEDVRFFQSFGIKLNDINAVILYLNGTIFGVLIFVLTILLIIFLYKFFLTPKSFKKKKVRNGILSILIFILVFSTLTAWTYMDKKIRNLPNWTDLARGNVQLYDNKKLINGFSEDEALVSVENIENSSSVSTNSLNLIGPIDIKFDLTNFASKNGSLGSTILHYEWTFLDINGRIIEEETTTEPTLIKSFTEKGKTIRTKFKIIGELNINRQVIDIAETTDNTIPSITIYDVVQITEKVLESGGKQVTFDASSLSPLGDIEWYNNSGELLYNARGGSIYHTNLVFEDTIFIMKIKRTSGSDIIRTFIIKGHDEPLITGNIVFDRDITNDLRVTFRVENAQSKYGGYIEKYKRTIGYSTTTVEGSPYPEQQEKSSEFTHIFTIYKDYVISVELIDYAGDSRTITETISLPKLLKITKPLTIYSDGVVVNDVKYNQNASEYYVNYLQVPGEVKFDTTTLQLDSSIINIYSLKDIKWDFDSNGDIDAEGKVGTYSILSEGEYEVTVYITYTDRRTKEEIQVMQKIFLTAEKKDAIVDLKIISDSEYVPVTVMFDASKSSIKDSNVTKFDWDFGDGIKQEGVDAVIPGHKYIKAGEYDIKVTITSQDGKSYSTTKKLVLKETPSKVKITTSMKRAPVGQGIDFSSASSEGQIASYYWDFGDGDISTLPNVSHAFNTPGKYKVTLRLEFTNRNVLTESAEIEIY